MNRKAYRTRRLDIRPYNLDDCDAWISMFDGFLPKQQKHDWVPPIGFNPTKALFRKIYARQIRLAKMDRLYAYPIFLRKTGELIGVLDVFIFTRDNLHVANLGYKINNNFQRQGFASEALKKCVPALLRDLSLNRLEAVIDTDNRPSIALVKSVGLVREGVRENYYFQDGDWADQVVFVADRKRFGLPRLILKPT